MLTTEQYRTIRAAMAFKGVTNESIANSLVPKVTANYVTFVITGRRVGHRVRAAIAKACEKPVTELWPDEEDEDLPIAA